MRAYDLGAETREAFEADNPPDLVIEVERSGGDGDKPSFYRRLGVPEMWRLDISARRREVVILDLQAVGGPMSLDASRMLPGVAPDFVIEAIDLAIRRRTGDLDALIKRRLVPDRAPEPPQGP